MSITFTILWKSAHCLHSKWPWLGFQNWPRTVEVYAKKPQIQERLTVEIADALMEYLGAQGALVWVEAEHMCMNMRGVRKPGTATVTTAARGLLATDKDLKK